MVAHREKRLKVLFVVEFRDIINEKIIIYRLYFNARS